jgi:hypothetical protein
LSFVPPVADRRNESTADLYAASSSRRPSFAGRRSGDRRRPTTLTPEQGKVACTRAGAHDVALRDCARS